MALGFDVPRDPVFELTAGWSRAFVIGRRSGVGAGVIADVWPGTPVTRPLPLTPKAMSIRSTGADSFGVSGAQQVVVTFIDSAGDWRTSDRLPMSGATPVPVTYFGTGTAFQRLGLSMLASGSALFTNDPTVTNVVQRSDFGVAMTPDNNGVDGLAVLEFRLKCIPALA